MLRKYDSVEEILKDFFEVRRQKYRERKTYLKGMLEAEASKLENQARFILEKIDGDVAIGTILLCLFNTCPVYSLLIELYIIVVSTDFLKFARLTLVSRHIFVFQRNITNFNRNEMTSNKCRIDLKTKLLHRIKVGNSIQRLQYLIIANEMIPSRVVMYRERGAESDKWLDNYDNNLRILV